MIMIQGMIQCISYQENYNVLKWVGAKYLNELLLHHHIRTSSYFSNVKLKGQIIKSQKISTFCMNTDIHELWNNITWNCNITLQVFHSVQWFKTTWEKCPHAGKVGELSKPCCSYKPKHQSNESGHLPGICHATEGAATPRPDLREPDAECCGHTGQVNTSIVTPLLSVISLSLIMP